MSSQPASGAAILRPAATCDVNALRQRAPGETIQIYDRDGRIHHLEIERLVASEPREHGVGRITISAQSLAGREWRVSVFFVWDGLDAYRAVDVHLQQQTAAGSWRFEAGEIRGLGGGDE